MKSASQSGKVISPLNRSFKQAQIQPHPLQAFELSQVLQTTLDVYDLIKRFHLELQKLVPYHSFHFHNLITEHGLDIGKTESHQVNYQLNVDGLSLGDFYLTKQSAFSPDELEAIEHALEFLIYPLRNAMQYHEAVKNSFTDPLTQVGNRAAYEKAIVREVDFAKRHLTHFAMLMIDVDKFKVINDRYGHQAGDYVLKALAKLMMQLNRNTDHLFRYGGEEFVVILNHTLAQGALFVGERMREQIEQNDFIYQGVKIPVTISIGISIFQKQDSAKELFTRADTALYTAKKSGRNQVFCLERSSN